MKVKMKKELAEKAKEIAEMVVAGDFEGARVKWTEVTEPLVAFECIILRDEIRSIEERLSNIRNEEAEGE